MSQPRVLNTRPRSQARELSRLLERAGMEAVEAPAIDVVPAWDAGELEVVRRQLGDGAFDWVVLASRNAALGLHEELRGARVLCGAGTAHALGLSPEIALKQFSATSALATLRTLVTGGQRLLVPRAAAGRDELLTGLAALSVEVVAPVAYHTIAVDDAARCLRSASVDVVTLCSPSAVRALATAVGRQVQVVCLGATTADAAREAGLRVDAIASDTSMASLVKAVESALAARGVVV
jgi:uroporphyrinogen-III synthase